MLANPGWNMCPRKRTEAKVSMNLSLIALWVQQFHGSDIAIGGLLDLQCNQSARVSFPGADQRNVRLCALDDFSKPRMADVIFG